jgi:hypothetical protein
MMIISLRNRYPEDPNYPPSGGGGGGDSSGGDGDSNPPADGDQPINCIIDENGNCVDVVEPVIPKELGLRALKYLKKQMEGDEVVKKNVRSPKKDSNNEGKTTGSFTDHLGLADHTEIAEWEQAFGESQGLNSVTHVVYEEEYTLPGDEGEPRVACKGCNESDNEYWSDNWTDPLTGKEFHIKKVITFKKNLDGTTDLRVKLRFRPGALTASPIYFPDAMTETEIIVKEMELTEAIKNNLSEVLDQQNSLTKAVLDNKGNPTYDVNGEPEMEIKTADDKDLSLFQKIGGYATYTLKAMSEAKTPESIYDDRGTEKKTAYDLSPINTPPLVGGSIDGLVDIVKSPIDMANTMMDLFKPDVAQSMLKELKGLVSLEGVKKIASGAAEGFMTTLDKINSDDPVEAGYEQGKQSVAILEIFAGGGLTSAIKKIGKGAREMLTKHTNGLWEKFGKFGKNKKPDGKFDKGKHDLNTVQLKKLDDDLAGNQALKDDMDGNPDLVDSWKKLDDLGEAGELVRKNPEALKKLDNAIKEGLDATDAIEDAIQTLGKSKPTWPEIQALFKRGNDFNRKVRSQVPNPYQYYEVTVEKTLSNGNVKRYRLDSYNPGSDIVSRKATDFNNIQTTTFQKYISELKNKYQTGLKIVKPGTPINGQTLQGAYKLEVPKSNLTSSKLTDFQQIASDNGVEIIFIDEF